MKIKTKKTRLIVKAIVCIVLSLAILIPATMFSLANDGKIYTSIKDLEGKVLASESLEYYDFNKGLFTSKQVTGPDENGEYTVTIDTYTSNVTYISAETQTLDIMVLFDRSGSMASNNRWQTFKDGLTTVLTSLVNNYNVGTGKNQNKVNLAMIGFDGIVYPNVLNYTAVSKSTMDSTPTKFLGIVTGYKGEIYNKINHDLAAPGGSTVTGQAFQKAEEKILKRMSNGNKQILLFFTDGVPAVVTGVSNTNNTYFPLNTEPNWAIAAANRLKAKGVDIYTIGCGDGFDENSEMSSAENGLAQWVTSGATYTEADDDQTGMKLRPRQIGVFMNMLSSGWIANKGKEEEDYDWKTCDKEEAIEIYNKYPGEYYNEYRATQYKKWPKLSDGWQNIPNDYTLNPKVSSNSMQYFFSASGGAEMAAKMNHAFLQSLATVQVSQGSLLGDYIVKDTVSSYFEIVPKSAEFCTVKYEGGYSNASAAKIEENYGEEDRNWSDVTEIAGKDLNWDDKTEITEGITYRTSKDKSYIEILAPVNNSTVIDTCVIDNVADSNNEKHSGNKLRITYKIRPKDSFMGGSSVPTHDYANSGIYKEEIVKDEKIVTVVQSFDKANSTDANPVPKMSVELVRPTKITANSNVKIGFLYPAENVGNTDVNVTYQGRYSENGAYNSYIMNADSGIVYDKDGTEISYGSYTVENDKDNNKSGSSAASGPETGESSGSGETGESVGSITTYQIRPSDYACLMHGKASKAEDSVGGNLITIKLLIFVIRQISEA